MKSEVIATRGHLKDLSEEWAALGHLSFVEGEIVSRDLISFAMELDITNIPAGLGPQNYIATFSSRTGLSVNALRCQQFTAIADGITDIALPLFREQAATQNAIVQIRELVWDGTIWIPTGTMLAEIIVLPGDVGQYTWSPGMSIPWIKWTFPATIPLEVGKQYGIFVYSLETSSLKWRWALQTGLFYGGGDFVYSNDGGASWLTYTGYDLPFQLWSTSRSYIENEIETSICKELSIESIIPIQGSHNYVLDQMNDAPVTVQDASSNLKIAQTFLAGATGVLGKVEIYNRRSYDHTLLWIYDTVGGLPNNPIAGPFHASSFDSGGTIPPYHWSSYNTYCNIQSGVLYAIVVEEVDLWVATRSNPYPNGAPWYWNSGTSQWMPDWTFNNDDYCFKTYMDTGEGNWVNKEFELELINEEEP